jgi:hypothetical protein
MTWELAYADTARVYSADMTREFYRDNGWGSLLNEMASNGLPVWSSGTASGVWAHGAGWVAAGAPGVALLGVELFPEFNNPTYSGGDCPGGVGDGAWPCTPEGAYAHELGHTLGLAHPLDIPETQADALHSVMQTHWNYPNHASPDESPWGFLTLERQTIWASPFAKEDVSVVQIHNCDIVNLPNTGTPPSADFRTSASAPLVVSFTNRASEASLLYWDFGDGGNANSPHPTHAYEQAGLYPVRLRASAPNGMMDRETGVVTAQTGVLLRSRTQEPRISANIPTSETLSEPAATQPWLEQSSPNPFDEQRHGETIIRFHSPTPGHVNLVVYNLAGQRVAELVDSSVSAGVHAVAWTGRNDSGHEVAPGRYAYVLIAGDHRETRLLTLLR